MQLNHTVCTFLAATIIVTACADDSKAKRDIPELLLQLEREAIAREFKNDTSFLSSVMDSTFIELSGHRLKNKHEVLATIWQDNHIKQKQGIVRDSFRLINPVINEYGNAAVVTFVMKTFNHKGDSLFTRHTRFYDVWVKRENEWKAITWQGSPLDY